jgi:hypothetical protein
MEDSRLQEIYRKSVDGFEIPSPVEFLWISSLYDRKYTSLSSDQMLFMYMYIFLKGS